jgi:hypothetical protein
LVIPASILKVIIHKNNSGLTQNWLSSPPNPPSLGGTKFNSPRFGGQGGKCVSPKLIYTLKLCLNHNRLCLTTLHRTEHIEMIPQLTFDYSSEQIGGCAIVQAYCFEWLARVPENSIHAVVTDPPYGVK